MTLIGYTMMCEQAGPKQLVRDVALAEEAGFDFAVISDHYSPWLESQGHSPYAWSVLGAAAQATDRIPLMTYVTCPIRRYHPAVVAQKAATMQLLSDGRFTLGLGAGENLNEHIVGGRWPLAGLRHQMLEEAVEIIRALWAGGTVTIRGKHFDVESAKLWDLPDLAPPIGIAVSGPESCRLAGHARRCHDRRRASCPAGRALRSGAGAPASRASARSRCHTTPISASPCSGRWISSDGSRAAGESTPSCPFRRRSTRHQGRYATTTWPPKCPAAPTSAGTSPGYASSRRPGSPTSRWCRSAGTPKSDSSTWAATELLPALRGLMIPPPDL